MRIPSQEDYAREAATLLEYLGRGQGRDLDFPEGSGEPELEGQLARLDKVLWNRSRSTSCPHPMPVSW